MGCDIHFVIEKKEPNGDGGYYWLGMAEGGRMPLRSRNYPFFGELAGVRCDGTIRPDAKPNGIPEDASSLAKYHIKRDGSDGHSHGHIPLADALLLRAQVDLRCAKYSMKQAEATDKVELKKMLLEGAEKELERADAFVRWPTRYIEGLSYEEMEESEHEYGSEGYLKEELKDYRIVFWFDN